MATPTEAALDARATIVTDKVTDTYHDHPEHPAHSITRHTEVIRIEQELTERHKQVPRAWEILFGILLLFGWVTLFASGAFVPTDAYRNELIEGKVRNFWHFAVVICCYTVTNILFLSVLSACLGCMACRWRVTGRLERLMHFYSGLSAKRIYFAATLRGFFLYLMIISGLLVLATEDTVLKTGFTQYIRVAGITSVFGFLAGFNPQIAYRLMGKINDLANKPLERSKRE